MEALRDNYIWAASGDHLNDIFETLIDSTQLHQYINKYFSNGHNTNKKRKALRIVKALEIKRAQSGIYSLSKDWDNELLWAHYSDCHKGFCIEYNINELIKLQNPNYVDTFKIEYTNKFPALIPDAINTDNSTTTIKKSFSYNLYSTKSKPWEYEQEIRIVFLSPGRKYYLSSAIKSITLGIAVSEYDKKRMLFLALQKNITVYQCKLLKNSYLIDREIIYAAKTPHPTINKSFGISTIKLSKDLTSSQYSIINNIIEYLNTQEWINKVYSITIGKRQYNNVEIASIQVEVNKKFRRLLAKRIGTYPLFCIYLLPRKKYTFTLDINYITQWIDTMRGGQTDTPSF